jgi:hypothetical protein
VISDSARALAEALKLAEEGFPVFPARLCKTACCKCHICKSPFPGTHGFKDAMPDPVEVKRLWRRYPGPLIGVPTGEASGFDVLDIDSAKHREAVVWYFDHKNMVPRTRTHITASGGCHLLFNHDPGARQGQARFAPGVDVRAEGGYIIWWPAAGKKLIHDVPMVNWPRWMIKAMQPTPPPAFHRGPGQGANSLEHLANFVAGLPEGQRNSGTFWGFCRAFEAAAQGSVSESEAWRAIADAALRTGLSLTEVRTIARSARTRSGKGIRQYA